SSPPSRPSPPRASPLPNASAACTRRCPSLPRAPRRATQPKRRRSGRTRESDGSTASAAGSSRLPSRFCRVDLHHSPEDAAFRAEARNWLTDRLTGQFANVRGRGGPGDEHALFDERLAWERALGAERWTCLSFPEEYGGRDASLLQQVIFYEEYARAG